MNNLVPDESDLILITEQEEGERLDKILAKRFQEIQSRTYFQFLIDEGRVLLNGVAVKKRSKPMAGDEVEINFIITPEVKLIPENIPLDIVYEDDDIIVINKPVGMVVHPAPGHWSGTFVNALLYHCKDLIPETSATIASYPRPGIVHRLDKETSGLLIAAKSSLALQRLIEMFSSREIYKEYLAICIGNPGDRSITAPIGRHPVHRKQMAVLEEGGKPSLSICKALAWNDKLSLVSVNLATGRTHQIRVHMRHIGTPILGDSTYGNVQMNKRYHTTRQLLHAYILRFKHPITGKLLEFKAAIPEDMSSKFPTFS